MAKDRRIQNIDRFVVETFKNRACKIFVGINDQDDWSRFTRNFRRTTDNQTRDIILNNELQPSRDAIDRISICHQSALSVRPLIHFGL